MSFFSLLFIVVNAACLFAPGFVVSRLFVFNRSLEVRALLAIGLSYAIYVIVFVVSNHLALDSELFNFLYGCLVACSLAVCLFKSKALTTLDNYFLFDLALVAIVVVLYHCFIGAYDEIPSDVYTHLTRYQFAIGDQVGGGLGQALSLVDLFSQKGLVWYHFVATINSLFDFSAEQVHYLVTLVTKTTLLLSVYLFARVLFKDVPLARLVALISTLLFAVYVGINIFAYIRYYSFAPTMLAYVLFLAALALFVEVTCHQKANISLVYRDLVKNAGLVLFLFMAMMAVHMQEALFLLISVSCISFSVVISRLFGEKHQLGVVHYLISFLAMLCFWVAYFYARTHFERAPNIGWRLWDFGGLGFGLPQITVLNARFQFLEVVTYFGCFVYLAFFFNLKLFRRNIVLLGGMLIPIFTVFNPIFVDFFLRVYTSTLLYRILYVVPIHFVAALIIVHSFKQIQVSVSKINCYYWLGVLVLMLGLLMFPTKPEYRQYSRWQTLQSVDDTQGMPRYADLVDYLKTEPKAEILTDPVVGYYIAGLTHHRYLRINFYHSYVKFTFNDYSHFPLSSHKGKLLLINKRMSVDSKSGRLSGHWPASIFLVDKYYPSALIDHLGEYPKQFTLKWRSETKDIALYRIE